jgi:hypothetical protein
MNEESKIPDELMSDVRVARELIAQEYIRPRMEILRDYAINIRFLSLGCVVQVGCKEIAFTSIEEAMKEVNAYVANPRELEKKYNKLINEQN